MNVLMPQPMSVVTWERPFPGMASYVRVVRDWARACLESAVAQEERFSAPWTKGLSNLETVRTVVSELAANAILHSKSGEPDGWLYLTIGVHASEVRIRVADMGVSQGPAWFKDAQEENFRRGLALVKALSTRSGIRGNDNQYSIWARTVWADISRGEWEWPAITR